MKMCFNWKVIAGLVAGAIGVYILAPQLVLGALPLLLFAICPLSMLLMHGMGGHGAHDAAVTGAAKTYTCPMHPEVQSSEPGRCPTCGMNLVPLVQSQSLPRSPESETSTPLTREEQLRHLRFELQRLNDRQTALAEEVELLQAGGELQPSLALQEAEQVARAADQRP